MFFRDRNPNGPAARLSLEQFSPNFRSADERKFDKFTSTLPDLKAAPISKTDMDTGQKIDASLNTENSDEFLFKKDDQTETSSQVSEDKSTVTETSEATATQSSVQAETLTRAPETAAAEPSLASLIQQVRFDRDVINQAIGGSDGTMSQQQASDPEGVSIISPDVVAAVKQAVAALYQAHERGSFNLGWAGPTKYAPKPNPEAPGTDDDSADTGGDTGDQTGGDTGGDTGDDTGGDTGGQTGGDTGGQTGGQTGGDVGDQTGGDTDGQTGGDKGDQTGGDTGGQTGGDTGDQTGGDAGDNTGGQTGGDTGGQTGGDTGGDMGDDTGGDTGGQTGDDTGDQTGGDTGGQTGDDAGGDTGGQTGGDTDDQTGGQAGGDTGSQTGGGTGGQTGGDTGSDTGDQTGGDTGGQTGGQTGGDMGGHAGSGHMGSPPSIPGYDGPFPPATTAQINAFIVAVRAEDDDGAHAGMQGMSAEHAAALDLMPRVAASHIAIDNGAWDNPNTWHNGQVPGDGASVLIPDGIMVNYDHVSDVSLFTVRVDGMLSFATDVDSRMEVDTLLVAPEGHLQIGTEANPVQPGVNVDIVIADNGNIDTSWDPMLMSRGVISHGEVEIFGAEKTSFEAVATDPMAGDTVITLDDIPEGWQVGDKLVITGTQLQGWYWDQAAGAVRHHESQDEEVFITAIDGGSITIDRPLAYDHGAPDGDFSAHVANMTRNITFSSEGGEDLPVHQRGHVMFMHSDDVDVRYAGFEDLGRTDKSFAAFAAEDLGTLNYDSNIQGRYSLHFHRTGTEDQENPAIAVGNVVDGNPGWGFVHHDSHAEFTDNIAYDVFGAAFAAESGNETGIWLRNMAIDVRGVSYGESEVKLQSDVERHDNGRTGEGFFFAGRLVEAAENIAANTTHGFVYMHRGQPFTPLSDNLDQPETAYGAENIRVDQAPIHGFRDNEAYASQIGFIVVKNGPDQNHDVRSIIDGFTAWEVAEGINISYTSHYTFLDTTLIGSDNPNLGNTSGVILGPNTLDAVMNGLQVEGFDVGMNFDMDFHTFSNSSWRSIFIDADLSGNQTETVGFNPDRYTFLSSSDLTEGRLSFDMQGATVTSLGNGFTFDGIKTDSIGATDRQFTQDIQGFDQWGEALRNHLETNGYYELADGTNVIMVEDFVADRATGELMKFSHVIELANSDGVLNNAGYTNNGLLNPGGPSADAGDDRASTGANQDVYIDVLANDFDPDGGLVRVDGMVDPQNGDVFLQDDGTIMYRPNRDFTGTDSFRYWAADEEGNFTPATVTIEVWDGLG